MKKHSVSIRGHSTSFSLEPLFWDELKSIANARRQSIAQLVTQIDARRGDDENLSSALRVFILRTVKKQLEH